MNTMHTIGFGFASAQSSGSLATALALRPARSKLRLWRGRHLHATEVRQLHLLQVRPAVFDNAFRDRDVLTDACHEDLIRRYDVIQASLLLLGAQSWGRALIAASLMSAWRMYLALDSREQAMLALVIVDEGNSEEHAGIMFRQQKITCIRVDTKYISAGADCAVFDRGLCIVGDTTLLRALQSERRSELVLPDDCAPVFDRKVLTSGGSLVLDCAETLAQLRELPISIDAHARLLASTEQPLPTRWISRLNGKVESPSLLAAIWRSQSHGRTDSYRALTEFANDYERAFKISQGWPHSELPVLFTLSSAAYELVASDDLRIIIALIKCEAASEWASADTLRRLLEIALLHFRAGRHEVTVVILDCVALLSVECRSLPVYEQDDVVAYCDELVSALEAGISVNVINVVRSLELPITSVVLLLNEASIDPSIIGAIESYQQALMSFKGVVSSNEATAQLIQTLNDSYLALRIILCQIGHLSVAEQIKGSLVETYDASLKGLLGRVVDAHDAGSYQRYLLVMQGWVELLATGLVCERQSAVLGRFHTWLHQWANEALPDSFNIRDRNWRFEFETIVSGHSTLKRYENPHVLHNLLHQYSLAELRLETLCLPKRLRELKHFCETFSGRSTKILRFERALFEIQIPMGTHKASYIVTPEYISVEWAEPPDCPDDEIARILAFEVILDQLKLWLFPGLTFRREQVFGTWTLFIRLNVEEATFWQYGDLKEFLVATRFVFDASYDFSYVANDAINGFRERFHGMQWEKITRQLIKHRSLLEDVSQYVPLHVQPMSSTVGAIAQSRVIRGLLLRCLRREFSYSYDLIKAYGRWLTQSSGNSAQWSKRYESLRQLSLFLVVNWPQEAFSLLARRDIFTIGDDLIAACLFKRSDMVEDLRRVLAMGASPLAGISGAALRHAPHIVVTVLDPSSLALDLIDTGAHFRRAKHFLVARFSERLEPSVLTRLLGGLDTVPWGQSAETEIAIQKQLALYEPVCRFELERGVDWVTLDLRRTSGQWPTVASDPDE